MYSEWDMNGKKRLILLVYVLMRLTGVMFNSKRSQESTMGLCSRCKGQ